MLVKRVYEDVKEGAEVVKRRLPLIEIINVGGKLRKFSPNLIQGGIMEGWLELSPTHVTFKTPGGPIKFKITRTPGYFCCYCGKAVNDGAEAREHIQAEHPGAGPSPDRNNPHGYGCDNAYVCEREGE
jgi:hypothetical protein